MNIEEFRDYCLSKPRTTEHTPFGPDTLVFKVMNKMFALTGLDNFEFINLKCDPERALELRSENEFIKPGYHMNKQHWNSVYIEVGDKLIKELTNHSYDLIVDSLPKKLKEDLKNL